MGGAAAEPEHLNYKSLSLSFLTKGSQVEVTSDEDGFTGAWFVATVIHPPSSISTTTNKKSLHFHNNLVYVEYHNLLSEEGSSKHLREYADVSFVRPSPPPLDNNTDFELNDVVDAFYRDGWWTGVITGIVDCSNFVVTFPNPPDKIQFHISDLRVHRKWVDGIWVRPEKQRTAGLMFSVGKKVEVSFEREDLRGVWFPAIVLEDSGKGSFVIEYKSPGIDYEPTHHKVTVDYLHIRPSPPHLRDKTFVLLEKVDAFYDFGWSSGVITKELANSRYVVFFKHINKQRELSHSELRPHMQWKDGKWFSASQDTVSNNISSAENAVLHGESNSVKGVTEGRATQSSADKPVEQTNLGIDKQSSSPTSAMKRKKQGLDSNDKHSLPSKKLKDGLMGSHVAPNKSKKRSSVGQIEGCNPDEAIASDQAFVKTENLSHGKKVRSKREKGVEPNTLIMDSARKKGRPTAELRSSKTLAQGHSAKKATPDIVEKEPVTKETPTPIVIGLQCNVMRMPRGKKLQQLSSEKTPNVAKGEKLQLDAPVAPTTMVNLEKKGTEAETITPRRKRGRPPKLQAISPEASAAVNHQNGDVAPGAVAVMDGSGRNEVGSSVSAGTESTKEDPVPAKEQPKLTKRHNTPKQKNASSTVMKFPLSNKANLPEKGSGEALTAELGKYASIKGKRGKRRTMSINSDSSAQDSQDVSKEKDDGRGLKDSTRRNPEMSLEKSIDTMSDDQPLSRWFEGMHSPITVDGAAAAREGTLEQSSEASDRQLEIVTIPLVSVNGDMVSCGGQDFPFVRNTPLWQTVKSMEVFRMIPQKPHFRPLDGVKESAREGLAIGSMVTFSTVVEKTSALRFDDPRSAIEEGLETLVELESHGFDVKLIRDRLTALLLIKDKQEELLEQSNGLKDKIEEHKVESEIVDEEVVEIDKQISELQERRVQLLSKKEKQGSEVDAMKAAADGISKDMSEARLEFDGLAAAPW